MSPKLTEYIDKLFDALFSRRAQVFAGAVLLLLFRERLGLDAETTKLIQQAAIAWIVADSLRSTKSRITPETHT